MAKVTYVGHSQGTTQFWLGNIVNQDLGQKIETMIGVAPVMYVGNQTSIMATLGVNIGLDVYLEEHFWSLLWIK